MPRIGQAVTGGLRFGYALGGISIELEWLNTRRSERMAVTRERFEQGEMAKMRDDTTSFANTEVVKPLRTIVEKAA